MKIIFLARLFYPHIGGVEKHVMQISKLLLKQGHHITVITEKYDITLKDREIVDGIAVIRLNLNRQDWFKKFSIWSEILKYKNEIAEADIVHCHDVFFWYLPFRFIYPKKKVFTTFHGYESYPIKRKAILMRKLSENLSYGNICIGDFMKKWYGTKPIIVSYGAVDIPKNMDSKPKQHSALFYGRLDNQTGILEYIEASNLIRKQIPDFELLVIGDGELKEKINASISLKHFEKNPEQEFNHFRFAFLSRYLSILEAFAAKRLVFALYDNPVKEDYLKLTPYKDFIIIEKDPQKLAEKVIYYLKHPQEEDKLINKAYLWVKEQNWDKMTDNYLRLWNVTL